MRKTARLAAFVVVVGACFALGLATRHDAQAVPVAGDVRGQISRGERLQLDGINARWRSIDESIAQVITDQRTRRSVIQFFSTRAREVIKDEDEFFDSVRRRIGAAPGADVSVTDTGTAWVASASR